MTPEEIISDEEIDRVHANANFGPTLTKRQVVDQAVLKSASGYYHGHTSTQIITEHGLINKKGKLTKKGQEYLWASFKSKVSV